MLNTYLHSLTMRLIALVLCFFFVSSSFGNASRTTLGTTYSYSRTHKWQQIQICYKVNYVKKKRLPFTHLIKFKFVLLIVQVSIKYLNKLCHWCLDFDDVLTELLKQVTFQFQKKKICHTLASPAFRSSDIHPISALCLPSRIKLFPWLATTQKQHMKNGNNQIK